MPPVEQQTDIEIKGQEEQPQPPAGVIQSAIKGTASALDGMMSAGALYLRAKYSPQFDLLENGTGVPWIDNNLKNIVPTFKTPDTANFLYDNPVTKMLQDTQHANDYLSKAYPGENLGTITDKAMKSASFKPEKTLEDGLLAPTANYFATQDWKKAGDFLANKVVEQIPSYIPLVIGGMAEVPHAAVSAYLGAQAAGQGVKEARSKGKSLKTAESYGLLSGVTSGLIFQHMPQMFDVYAHKLAQVFGKKMANTLLSQGLREALEKGLGKLAESPYIQNLVTLQANRVASMMMQHAFDLERRSIKQALAELVQEGLTDAVTLPLIQAPFDAISYVGGVYKRGGKLSSNELLAFDETINGIKNGFEDAHGHKLTQPQVVSGGLIQLEAIVKNLLNSGNFIDNPHILAGLEAVKNEVKRVHNERGHLKIAGLQETKLPLKEGQVYYSPLMDKVNEKLPNKATPEQVDALLREVPEEEVEFTGIRDFLKGKEKIDKKELMDYLDKNQIQVKEIMHGNKPEVVLKKTSSPNEWAIQGVDLWVRKEGSFYTVIDDNVGEGEEPYFKSKSLDKVKKWILDDDAHMSFGITSENSTKFYDYQTPGGSNYKELLLTLPVNEGKRVKGNEPVPKPSNFMSSHFNEPNVLAHVRFNERTDSEGKKTLFLEELQSDWHQKGRKEGYSNPKKNTVEGLKKKYPQLPEDESIWSMKKLEQAGVSEQERLDWYHGEMNVSGVPNAPFKKTWHELALRRMIKYALDNGFDKLAWTTGEQQAERYDLSHQIDSINYRKDGNDTYEISAIKNGESIITQHGKTAKQLEDFVGKDVAQKIANGEGKKSNVADKYIHTLSGIDLKVGGEGMKGFYDKIIPDYLNKFGKRFGARTEISKIESGTKEKRMQTAGRTPQVHTKSVKNFEDVNSLDLTPIRKGLMSENRMKNEGGFLDLTGLDKMTKGAVRAVGYLFEPAKIVEMEFGSKAYTDVMRMEHLPDRYLQELDNQKVKQIDSTVEELEKRFSKFSTKELNQFNFTRGIAESPEAAKLQEDAYKNMLPELKDFNLKGAIKQISDKIYEMATKNGIDLEYFKDYFYGSYKNKDAVSRFLEHWKSTERYTKEKALPTIADAYAYGLELKNPNPITNLKEELRAISHRIAMKQLRTNVEKAEFTVDVKGANREQLNKWKSIEDTVFKDLLFHPDYAHLVNSLISINKVAGNPIGRGLRAMTQASQMIKFFGSGFHMVNISKAVAAENGGGILNPQSWNDLYKLSKPIDKTSEPYLKYTELGGGHQYSIESQAQRQWTDFFAKARGAWKIPLKIADQPWIVGSPGFAKWMFNEFIPSAKYQSYLNEVFTQSKKLGRELTDSEHIRIIKQNQNFYGMMNERLFGRSGTVTSAMRLIFTAPGYGEGNFRTSFKAMLGDKRSLGLILNTMLTTLTIATIGTLLNGQTPDKPQTARGLRDLFKIKTNMLDKRGNRLYYDMMTYDKDYWTIFGNIATGQGGQVPEQLFKRLNYMTSAPFKTVTDVSVLVQGGQVRDWKNDPVYLAHDQMPTKILKLAKYQAQNYQPISISNFVQSLGTDNSVGTSAVSAFTGFRPTKSEQVKADSEEYFKNKEQNPNYKEDNSGIPDIGKEIEKEINKAFKT